MQSKWNSHKHSIVDMDTRIEDKDDDELKEELVFCNQFVFDCELEKDTVFLNLPCHPSTTHFNENMDQVFNQLNLAAEVNLAFGFVLKTLKMERKDTFMHTKTIQLWRSLNLCVLQMIWST